MKKHLFKVVSVILVCLLFVACNVNADNTKSVIYTVSTGDELKITLSGGYDIDTSVPFTVSKDGEEVSNGTFIDHADYSNYTSIVTDDELAKLVDSGSKDNIEYVMWNYDNKEYNYVMLIEGADTGIVLGNQLSEESAKDVFNHMTVEVVKSNESSSATTMPSE